MPENPRFSLHSVSLVVTAEFHNPSILNPDFLVSREIVPADWTVLETLTTPPVSVVKYENGVEWTVDQSRLTVAEKSGPAFGNSYRVHRLVDTYLRKLPHLPYRGLGLNCQVSTRQANPQRWLIERFGASWLCGEPMVRGMRPTFALNAGDAVCRISLVDAPQNGFEQIISDCNVHHQGPLDVDGLCNAIARWPERQTFIVSALATLFGSLTDMRRSDTTGSPAFEEVCRAAVLGALVHEDLPAVLRRDESRGGFVGGLTRGTTWGGSIHAPVIREFATAGAGGRVDSSTDDSVPRFIDRIIAATKHEEIIAVLPLLGLRAIADRLAHLHELTADDDPDEPQMLLASLRELALFFVSEPERDTSEIGISPDGHLQAEWLARDGGILAMKFLPAGFIQFAATSRPTGGCQRLRVQGTLPKDRVLQAVRGFIR